MSSVMKVEKGTPQPVPLTWVEKLFSRFSVMYGRKFLDMWQGIDIDEVKACWAHELGAYKPSQIGAAVEALKGRPFPPTLPEFLELCEKGVLPTAQREYLPTAKYNPHDPEIVEARERCMQTARELGYLKLMPKGVDNGITSD